MAFNEQEVLYEYQKEFCERIEAVLYDLGVRRLQKPNRRGREASQPHLWRVGDKAHDSDWRKETHITFDGITYNEDKPTEGKTVVQTFGEPRVIYSRIYDSDVEYLTSISQSASSQEEAWTEEDFNVSFSVTNRTTSKAEAKAEVGGVGASASVENETTTSLETGFGKSMGGREARATSLAVTGTFTVPAGRRILAYAEASKQQSTTPYAVHGYIDHYTKMDLYDWVEENAPFLRDSKDNKHNVIDLRQPD